MRSLLEVRRILVVALTLAAGVSAASEESGVIELNQACALAGTCVPGDSPGFPITIGTSRGGSYRLTSDLVTRLPGSFMIQVNADGTTIDLNGFVIDGPFDGDPVEGDIDCAGPQGGAGIFAPTTTSGMVVANGTIRGLGGDGILAGGTSHRIDRLDLIENCGTGLAAGGGTLVTRVRAVGNRGRGIAVGASSRIAETSADRNLGHGIEAPAGYVLAEGVTMSGYPGKGFLAGPRTFIRSSHLSGASLGVSLDVGQDSFVSDSRIDGGSSVAEMRATGGAGMARSVVPTITSGFFRMTCVVFSRSDAPDEVNCP